MLREEPAERLRAGDLGFLELALQERLVNRESALNDKEAEIERLKKDAERYRWLKSDDAAQFRVMSMMRSTYRWNTDIDAAIDAMRGDANG